jgi:hypothetical protein
MLEGKHQVIKNEIDRLNVPILGICEHRWRWAGYLNNDNGGVFIYSGRDKGGLGRAAIYLGLEKRMMEGYQEGVRGGDQKVDGFRISQTICK